jgi:hypothetical protein
MFNSNEKSRCICISLFCQEEYQNRLIGSGIKPFLWLPEIKSRLQGYHISFNDSRGENIRLCLFSTGRYCRKISSEADKFFTRFFSDAAFPIAGRPVQAWNTFMPFPENTIRYGLFYENTDRYDYSTQKFRERTSRLLMNILKGEQINEELRITLAIYLHIILIDAFCELSPGNRPLVENYYRVRGKSNSLAGEPEIVFEMDMQQLRDIHGEINPPGGATPAAWHSYWQRICTGRLRQLSRMTLPDKDKPLAVYFNISQVVNTQLNIRESSLRALWYALSLFTIIEL